VEDATTLSWSSAAVSEWVSTEYRCATNRRTDILRQHSPRYALHSIAR